MRRMVDQAMDRIVEHITSLPEQPMHGTAGGRKLARSLREDLPEKGRAFDALLRQLFGRIIPASLNTASPGYLAYIPGGGLFHAAVADLIADATNRYVGVFQAAPGLVQLEANVISWFCAMAGLPEGAGGVLTTGGSMANLIATVTARRSRLPTDFLRGTIYTSDQAHHSVRKAAMMAGFPPENVREVGVDGRFCIDGEALARAVGDDRARGLQPFMVVANAGSTNTGAVDDLCQIASLAEAERLWMHVDGAYGGFFLLTERGRAAMRGVERADSITLDPHKSLFLPYGTGCLLVRDAASLRRAHQMPASYMPAMQSEPDLVDFCELSPELSRDARGLRVWLPLKMHGASAFREALDEKLDLALLAADALRAVPHVELVAEPQLSLLAFRLRPAGAADGPELDDLNRRLAAAVNARQRVLLTTTIVRCGLVVRMCILSFRTHRDRVEAALVDIRSAAEEVLGATKIGTMQAQ
jgi:aromatic-L-amino-acid/L-tryptophan decarboxylase